jgi:hypothetical protein
MLNDKETYLCIPLRVGIAVCFEQTRADFKIRTANSLAKSSSLRESLGDYLDDYGSGPMDAAAANGINL